MRHPRPSGVQHLLQHSCPLGWAQRHRTLQCSDLQPFRSPTRPITWSFLQFPGVIFGPSKHTENKSSFQFFFDKCFKCPFKSFVLNFGDPTSLSFVAFDQNSSLPLRKRSKIKRNTGLSLPCSIGTSSVVLCLKSPSCVYVTTAHQRQLTLICFVRIQQNK